MGFYVLIDKYLHTKFKPNLNYEAKITIGVIVPVWHVKC